MQTASFKRLDEVVAAGLTPVAITRSFPAWFKGPVEDRLAPTWRMSKIERYDFDVYLFQQLQSLDPHAMWLELNGPMACLMCWEDANVWCHRRAVAEWFEKALNVEVTEFGLKREEVKSYRDLPHRSHASRPRVKPAKEAGDTEKPPVVLPPTFDVDFLGGGNGE